MGAKKDKSAERASEQARIDEEGRQASVAQGRKSIDTAFAPFNDAYYQGAQDDYLGYYVPQLEDQYGDAQKQLTYQLARSGLLNASSASNERFGDLLESYNQNRAQIGDQALGFSSDLRGRVEGNKQDLYSQNIASANPAAASSAAAASVANLQTPPIFSPLAEVFASLLNSGATGVAAERQGYPGFQTGIFTPRTTGGTSGTVIR